MCTAPVETDIVFRINRWHYIDKVWKTIKDEYAISDTDTEAKALFESYTAKLWEKGILVLDVDCWNSLKVNFHHEKEKRRICASAFLPCDHNNQYRLREVSHIEKEPKI